MIALLDALDTADNEVRRAYRSKDEERIMEAVEASGYASQKLRNRILSVTTG